MRLPAKAGDALAKFGCSAQRHEIGGKTKVSADARSRVTASSLTSLRATDAKPQPQNQQNLPIKKLILPLALTLVGAGLAAVPGPAFVNLPTRGVIVQDSGRLLTGFVIAGTVAQVAAHAGSFFPRGSRRFRPARDPAGGFLFRCCGRQRQRRARRSRTRGGVRCRFRRMRIPRFRRVALAHRMLAGGPAESAATKPPFHGGAAVQPPLIEIGVN